MYHTKWSGQILIVECVIRLNRMYNGCVMIKLICYLVCFIQNVNVLMFHLFEHPAIVQISKTKNWSQNTEIVISSKSCY